MSSECNYLLLGLVPKIKSEIGSDTDGRIKFIIDLYLLLFTYTYRC